MGFVFLDFEFDLGCFLTPRLGKQELRGFERARDIWRRRCRWRSDEAMGRWPCGADLICPEGAKRVSLKPAFEIAD